MPGTTKQKRSSKRKSTRSELIDAVFGKYRHVRTSSAKFAAEKRREIRREDRRR
jgi:hypothetical protein